MSENKMADFNFSRINQSGEVSFIQWPIRGCACCNERGQSTRVMSGSIHVPIFWGDIDTSLSKVYRTSIIFSMIGIGKINLYNQT